MILIGYRLLCAFMAGLILWSLVAPGRKQDKAVMVLILVPLVLRALLIK
jgi:hypothetical protein